jgi:Zn-dependent protease
MGWSFPIGRLTGIQIRVHLTFLLFLAWVGFTDGVAGGWREAIQGVALLCLVFTCVLLHELGHAWAARRFGIRTPDITLLPIGGLARLERIPERPIEEVTVALAGPAVSAMLALVFGALSNFELTSMEADGQDWDAILSNLFTINTGLLVFNLLPAFPLDGGRVFRALLAMRLNYGRATRIAAGTGQGLAVLLGAAGLLVPAPMLVFIAAFLFISAGSEASQVAVREASRGLRVKDAMMTRFTLLPTDARLADAADLLMHSAQHTFPIGDESERYLALLSRNGLISGLHAAGPMGPALSYARIDLPTVTPGHLFSTACSLMREFETPALPVLDSSGRLVGLFTEENVGSLLLMEGTTGIAAPAAHSRVAIFPEVQACPVPEATPVNK